MPIQKLERNPHHGVGAVLLLLTILTASVCAQATSSPNPPADPPSASAGAPQEDKPSDATPKPATKPLSEKEARQAQIAADTDRLYQLAQELKAEVAKSNKDTLSLSVIKKATEVEKLAKSLKDRMKTE